MAMRGDSFIGGFLLLGLSSGTGDEGQDEFVRSGNPVVAVGPVECCQMDRPPTVRRVLLSHTMCPLCFRPPELPAGLRQAGAIRSGHTYAQRYKEDGS